MIWVIIEVLSVNLAKRTSVSTRELIIRYDQGGRSDCLVLFLTWILPTNAGQGLEIIAAVMASFRLGLLSNPWIWGGIAAMTVAQLLFTYAPLMNRMFHTAPIGLMDWAHNSGKLYCRLSIGSIWHPLLYYR